MGGLQPLNRWNASNASLHSFLSMDRTRQAQRPPRYPRGDRRGQQSHVAVTVAITRKCQSPRGRQALRRRASGACVVPVSPGPAACSGPTDRSAARLLKNYQRSAAMRSSGSSGRDGRARRKRRKAARETPCFLLVSYMPLAIS